MNKTPRKNARPGDKQSGFQRLTDAVLFTVPILAFVAGALWAADWLRLQQCPVGTFLTGTLYDRWDLAGLVPAALLFGFACRHFILHKAPQLGKWLKWKCEHDDRWHEQLSHVWMAFFLISVAGFGTVAFSQYCLTDTAILNRAQPWRPFVSQGWDQVREIDLACRSGRRGRTRLSYTLFMADRKVLNIGGNLIVLERAYPRIHQALDGRDFIFDTNSVSSNCPLSYDDPLRQKP